MQESEKKQKPKQRVQYAKSERYLLTKVYQRQSEVRLITYTGTRDVKVKRVDTYDLYFTDAPPLKKIEVLMAFPKSAMPALKEHVKRRSAVASQGMRAIEKIKERPKVEVPASVGGRVNIVLRNGLVVKGVCKLNSKYTVLVGVKGVSDPVLVYKHGIFELKTERSKTRNGVLKTENKEQTQQTHNLKQKQASEAALAVSLERLKTLLSDGVKRTESDIFQQLPSLSKSHFRRLREHFSNDGNADYDKRLYFL